MPIDLYFTQKVRGFQQSHVEYFQEKAVYELKRTEQDSRHAAVAFHRWCRLSETVEEAT